MIVHRKKTKMRRRRLIIGIFCLILIIFLLFYILMSALATGRDVALKANARITEYSQMVEADHKTLLSMLGNLKSLHQRIKTVDLKSNETKQQLLDTFNSKLDVHKHLLDYLHEKKVINKLEKQQHQQALKRGLDSTDDRVGVKKEEKQ